MRFLYFGIGFKLALYGLSANLAASAAPQPVPHINQTSSYRLTLQQPEGSTNDRQISNTQVIQGNGVEFSLPAGFQGGAPSSADTKTLTTETAKMFPSMASFVSVLDTDPSILRAIAINTKNQTNTEVVLITRLRVPPSVSLTEIEEMMSKILPSMLPPEFSLVGHKIENMGSRQIVHLTVDANIEGYKVKESIGLFREGGEVYQVTYVYANQNAGQAMPVFKQIIDTFKVTPVATTTNPATLLKSN